MKQLPLSIKLSLLTCFYFIGIMKSNSQSSCITLTAKVPKVAIVSAGLSKKVCGVNTTTLEAQIPDWITGEWSGQDYSNSLSPVTTYTNRYGFTEGGSQYNKLYRSVRHEFHMKLNSISNSPNFFETVTSVFFPENNNPNLTMDLLPNTQNRYIVNLNNSNFLTKPSWVLVDGPYVDEQLLYNSGFLDLYYAGTYKLKVGIFGCNMNYATTSLVQAESTWSGSPPTYKKQGFIEAQIEPIELISAGLGNSYQDENGLYYGEDKYSPGTFRTGTYTLSTAYPINFDQTSITALPPVSVNVSANSHQVIPRRYEYRKGRLTVALTSSSCNSNNENFTSGAWSIDGVSFYSSFSTIDIPIGTYTVYFRDQQGYVKPKTTSITVEGNKRTVVLGEYQTNNDFTVNSNICNNETVRNIEELLSVSSNTLRSDYHCYSSNLEVCSTSASTKPCTLEAAWNFYKNERNYQAPILSDFPSFVMGMPVNPLKGIEKLFMGKPTLSELPLSNCQRIELPNSFLMSIGHLNFTFDGDMLIACPEWYNIANITSVRTDPIFTVIDETNKCAINYTLPGHTLYPGKVKRCLYQECDKIYIKTIGVGLHFCGDNLAGSYFKELNRIAGDEIFINASKRYINDFKNR